MSPLISVQEALDKILVSFGPNPEELCDLDQAYDRVISRDVAAVTDLPPFTNSSMDGFAVRSDDLASATVEKPAEIVVDYDIPAGSHPVHKVMPGHAARIMTGAPLPAGADAVIQVELTSSARHESRVDFPFTIKVYSSIKNGENIRPKGMDITMGETLIRKSSRLRPQEISALAAIGIHQVPVFRQPRVAILSTGDELVSPETVLTPGKIHESNSYSLIGLSRALGCQVFNLGIVADQKKEIENKLNDCVQLGVDLIITSAGVSVGAFDYVKDVIESAGEINFWRVNMRPGKPVAFGNYRSIPLIGLAGNPVSAFVGFLVFVRPVILKLSGITELLPKVVRMTLDAPIESDGRQSYLRANSHFSDGVWIAHPASHQGSGNVLSMVNANTLLIIPSGVKSLPINAVVDAWLLD